MHLDLLFHVATMSQELLGSVNLLEDDPLGVSDTIYFLCQGTHDVVGYFEFYYCVCGSQIPATVWNYCPIDYQELGVE